MATNTNQQRSIWLGGAISGVVAGLIMAAVAMLISYSMGMGFWLPVNLIAATFLGVDAIIGGFGSVMLGVVIHMVMSAVLGIIFAYLTVRIESAGAAFGAGLAFGIVVWLFATYVGLPLMNEVMADRVAMMPMAWFFEHLVFGAGLTLTPYFEHAVAPAGERPRAARLVHA